MNWQDYSGVSEIPFDVCPVRLESFGGLGIKLHLMVVTMCGDVDMAHHIPIVSTRGRGFTTSLPDFKLTEGVTSPPWMRRFICVPVSC